MPVIFLLLLAGAGLALAASGRKGPPVQDVSPVLRDALDRFANAMGVMLWLDDRVEPVGCPPPRAERSGAEIDAFFVADTFEFLDRDCEPDRAMQRAFIAFVLNDAFADYESETGVRMLAMTGFDPEEWKGIATSTRLDAATRRQLLGDRPGEITLGSVDAFFDPDTDQIWQPAYLTTDRAAVVDFRAVPDLLVEFNAWLSDHPDHAELLS